MCAALWGFPCLLYVLIPVHLSLMWEFNVILYSVDQKIWCASSYPLLWFALLMEGWFKFRCRSACFE